MPRYLMKCSYDGTAFFGYQKQVDKRTVQEEIEKIISKLLNTPTSIYASGRTDAGVHAHGQYFHFDSPKILEKERFMYALNALLPKDIHIISMKGVAPDFHARYQALAKKYVYVIHQGEDDPFLRNTTYQLHQSLNVEKMKIAAETLKGTLCYRNFTSKEEDEKDFVRTIYAIHFHEENHTIRISFLGDGFMRYMVRMLVGSFIAIGLGKEEPDYFTKHLYTETRQITSYKAPAQGLFLEEVYYFEALPFNFHTHTKRCGHACGEDEEYVQAAIQAGIKTLGFSDHIFYPNFQNEPFPHVRGDYTLLEDYLHSILELKEKYQEQIDIHVGFEAEYYEDYDAYYKELLESGKIEYLILGQHFLRTNGVSSRISNGPYDEEGVKRYTDALIAGMKTGYYRYVAHPDLYLCFYHPFDAVAKEAAHRICEAANECHLPLELNLGGARRGLRLYNQNEMRLCYPVYEFWKIVAEHHCKVVIGVDAHDPKNFLSPAQVLAREIADDLNLDLTDEFPR